MLFKIIDGKPYLWSNGRIFQVNIEDGGKVVAGEEVSLPHNDRIYTIHEIKAKCKVLSSIEAAKEPVKKPRVKKDAAAKEPVKKPEVVEETKENADE